MEDIKTKALQAHSEGRLVEAELSYRILLEESDDPEVAVNLGALLRSQRRLKDCSSHYHQCLERWPREHKLILNACNCWRDTGESAPAIHWLRNALKEEPDDTKLVEALAEMLGIAGETAEATYLYESILQAEPNRIQLARPRDTTCPFRTARTEQNLLSASAQGQSRRAPCQNESPFNLQANRRV